MTLVTLDCGHQHQSVDDVQVGDEHPCWSSCDGVPTMRVPRTRRVVAVLSEQTSAAALAEQPG